MEPQSHSKSLLDAIDRYEGFWTTAGVSTHIFDAGEQRDVARRFRDFLATGGDRCADRRFLPGHLTGSAVVVTSDLTRVLLTLHRKLNRWLQLGGHADGSFALSEVAMREACEESGLTDLRFVSYAPAEPLIFDLDVHWIPPRKEAGHYHYDARYLLTTASPDAIAVSDESHELRWFGISDALKVTRERSMHRLLEKIAYVRDHCLKRASSPQGSRFEKSI